MGNDGSHSRTFRAISDARHGYYYTNISYERLLYFMLIFPNFTVVLKHPFDLDRLKDNDRHFTGMLSP